VKTDKQTKLPRPDITTLSSQIPNLHIERYKMQYTPFASDIELPFYTSLASHKINHDKLDDSARAVLGLYEIRPSDPEAASCRIQIHGNALMASE
jgi:hypothetical protein